MKVECNNIDSTIKNFTSQFILRTEGISYFIIVPVLLLFLVTTLSISHKQLFYIAVCTAFAFPISFITTQLNNIIATRPIQRYFNGIVKNEDIPDEMYNAAFKRLLALPYIHSIGAFFRWVFGLSMFTVPLTVLNLFKPNEVFIIWSSILIAAPSGTVLYFLLTEIFIQNIYNKGIFPKIPPNFTSKYRMNITIKLILSITIIVFTPFFIMIAFIASITNQPAFSLSGIWWQIIIFGSIGLVFSILLAKLLSKTLTMKTSIIKEFLNSVGEGNLAAYTKKIAIADELADINIAVYDMKENLKAMVGLIFDSSRELKTTSEDMKSSAIKFSEASRDLTAIIEETSSAYEEMSSSFEMIVNTIKSQVEQATAVKENIDSINQAGNNVSQQINALANTFNEAITGIEKGRETMQHAVAAITDISNYLQTVESTVSAINEVADQINLLALNAAIEAARAGEHGRGFAVVADEVNKLADQTATLVKSIQSTIDQYTGKVKNEIQFISHTANLFETVRDNIVNTGKVLTTTQEFTKNLTEQNTSIQEKIQKLVQLSNEIYATSHEQQITIDELTKAINAINEVASHTSDESGSIQSISQKIEVNAANLLKHIEFFKL
ncbi:MAG TPA: methyl-accepting chemotaxis protein [Spirochaetota bacterium]|nr:methyl-accepting chemotaxis protein [Spirochaetota bacterium]